MKKIYLILILIGILVIAGCGSKQSSESDQINDQGVPKPIGNIIEIGSTGFSPNELRVNAGDTVTFVNKDTIEHWPASAVHPTHAVYPEAGGCIGSKFDACKGLKQGESWSFTFTQKGTWGYHDHLNPDLRGKVIVQ